MWVSLFQSNSNKARSMKTGCPIDQMALVFFDMAEAFSFRQPPLPNLGVYSKCISKFIKVYNTIHTHTYEAHRHLTQHPSNNLFAAFYCGHMSNVIETTRGLISLT